MSKHSLSQDTEQDCGRPPVLAGEAQLQRQIIDIDQRIVRQQRRVEKVLFNREGPADETQALLDEMIKVRDLMRSQLTGLQQKAVPHPR